MTQVLPQTSTDFVAALKLYEARPDKSYSLTDCRSMLAMRALLISEVLTIGRLSVIGATNSRRERIFHMTTPPRRESRIAIYPGFRYSNGPSRQPE